MLLDSSNGWIILHLFCNMNSLISGEHSPPDKSNQILCHVSSSRERICWFSINHFVCVFAPRLVLGHNPSGAYLIKWHTESLPAETARRSDFTLAYYFPVWSKQAKHFQHYAVSSLRPAVVDQKPYTRAPSALFLGSAVTTLARFSINPAPI